MADTLKAYKKIFEEIDKGYNELVEFLKEHNRFINTANTDAKKDKIYGYTWDGDDNYREWNCLAIRLDAEDEVEVFLSYWGEDDLTDEFLWENLKYGQVAYASTLIDILETIHEYI